MILFTLVAAQAAAANQILQPASPPLPVIAPPAPPAPPQMPAPTSNPHTASPKYNPGQWVNQYDYPAAALRQGEEGQSRFRLTIDPSGLVTACTITESSGSATLDSTTCLLISRRARFWPATDATGAPIGGTYSSSIRWQIPSNPSPQPGNSSIRFTVEVDGRVTGCVAQKNGSPSQESAICTYLRRVEPYRDAKGNPIRKQVELRNSVTVRDAPEP